MDYWRYVPQAGRAKLKKTPKGKREKTNPFPCPCSPWLLATYCVDFFPSFWRIFYSLPKAFTTYWSKYELFMIAYRILITTPLWVAEDDSVGRKLKIILFILVAFLLSIPIRAYLSLDEHQKFVDEAKAQTKNNRQ
ncbi:hypothetical protein N5D73_04040 [Aeromonas caviae]|uniref:Uncharacterized protein n=2 Tax=Aeromonas caviae TaxID=648 RepID=A0AA42UJS7_AERCA|nr:hypothetical protein [Aeromonas caviae]MBL0588242.1 hypothetical protein [Aeromonas caviae]MDH1508074.1 hypothetical protein [Aeromonas caviae]MDH1803276.1 hypothetical protein [Aeromonas caviae]